MDFKSVKNFSKRSEVEDWIDENIIDFDEDTEFRNENY